MAHETIECDLQNKSEEFIDVYKRANPGGRAKVPVLEIDGETLVESSVTVEYLAERSGAPFYPASAAKRASARLMAEIQPFQNYFAFIKVRDDKEKLAEKVAAAPNCSVVYAPPRLPAAPESPKETARLMPSAAARWVGATKSTMYAATWLSAPLNAPHNT